MHDAAGGTQATSDEGMVRNEKWRRYLLAFGSNQGDRKAHARSALSQLAQTFEVLKSSPWVITAPLSHPLYDTSAHENYLNFVCEVRSPHGPEVLYGFLCHVEDCLGHERTARWQPRAMDIDILLAAQEKENSHSFLTCTPLRCQTTTLTIPHEGLWHRPFLEPLLEALGYPLWELKTFSAEATL